MKFLIPQVNKTTIYAEAVETDEHFAVTIGEHSILFVHKDQCEEVSPTIAKMALEESFIHFPEFKHLKEFYMALMGGERCYMVRKL